MSLAISIVAESVQIHAVGIVDFCEFTTSVNIFAVFSIQFLWILFSFVLSHVVKISTLCVVVL